MAEEITAVPAPERSSIAETGSITAHTARGTVHCITIVGQIEGHMELPAQNKTTKYEHLHARRSPSGRAGDEDIDGLLVLLNTVGGDVEAGPRHRGADRRHDKAHRFASSSAAEAIPSACRLAVAARRSFSAAPAPP